MRHSDQRGEERGGADQQQEDKEEEEKERRGLVVRRRETGPSERVDVEDPHIVRTPWGLRIFRLSGAALNMADVRATVPSAKMSKHEH